MPSFCITGIGSHIPATILTNDDLSRMVATSDDWITQHTGVKERRIGVTDETGPATGGTEAARGNGSGM